MLGDKPQKKRERPQGGRGGGDGGGDKGGDKANKKTKYYQQSKGGTGQAVPIGSRGLLVTCDAGREDKAGDEAVALIEEHYDKLTDPTAASAAPAAAEADEAKDTKDETEGSGDGADKAAAAGGSDSGSGSKDIAALLAAEVAEIKQTKGRGGRFRVHNTGVKGCIYVLFPPFAETKPGAPGPAAVARSIAQEAQDKKQVRGRHIVRFLPVTAACFAGLEEIKAAAPKLVESHFPDAEDSTPVEFAVEYEHRSAEGFERLDVINAFTAVIKTPPHKVNLKAPSKVVLVQLIRNGCAMAVVEGYKELAKFNVRKLAEVEEA
ncbi:hypothetical protein HYH03_002368 [Edaphochlamys debaryana]|uniref:THUMP domain-containing protein n=1 Tax=Edaphochlamys debaryana TaxID=47281 RepID=A0A836C3S9_9CHLO|nr:hypothetical protein HYH03_002368 [Edaphochlamys debaryana]|eukprot:KAG2499421.1 hypothetical protein HYH03_002368 [Edaphochlamys debaryana]